MSSSLLDVHLSRLEPTQLRALRHHYQMGITSTMQSALTDSPHDPIAAQFVPDVRELEVREEELSDPIGDEPHSPVPSLVHRYRNRGLWKINSHCAVYCRFCFRKEQIGKKGQGVSDEMRDKALCYLREHRDIEELILSGGDPWFLSPKRLAHFVLPVGEMAHIRRVRIHTRMPVVEPSAITEELLGLFSSLPQSIHVVIHINHAQELTPPAISALAKMRQSGMMLYSQSVLLRGVNDRVEVLADLMNRLLDVGVMPYYLHHLDLAKGTSHFRLTLAEGKALYQALQQRLSGIALPRYMVEIPGGGGKVPVMSLSDEELSHLQQLGLN
ncbi:MAG: KamA family radical SAM protein [Cardiobacteriaceae bacterium]|nr:KamA family radical SAM protein [Cardiobacteriaceae bacterium]